MNNMNVNFLSDTDLDELDFFSLAFYVQTLNNIEKNVEDNGDE